MSLIEVRQCLEPRQRPFDHFRLDAIGDPEVAGSTEAAAGDQQQVEFLAHSLNAMSSVPVIGEQVEGSTGLDHLVAHLSKCVGQQGAVAFIGADVRRQVTAFRRHPLKQAGGIDISLRAACTCRRGVDGISVRHLLGDQHIAQPLAREGKGLGKGVADDGVLVDLRYQGTSTP